MIQDSWRDSYESDATILPILLVRSVECLATSGPDTVAMVRVAM